MRYFVIGENLGSGFPLILSTWNEKHWLKPELIEQRELMQVKLVLSIETKDVVKGIPQEILKELTERQLVILDMIASDAAISAKAMSDKMSEKEPVDERTI